MQKVIEINNTFVSIFGSGIIVILWQVGRHFAKLTKAKKQENILREQEITMLKQTNAEQDVRLQAVEDYQANAEERSRNLVKANKASLHNQIWSKADLYIERGYVTVGELNNFDYLYNAYKALGGNGTGDMLYKKVTELPPKDEGILKQKEINNL